MGKRASSHQVRVFALSNAKGGCGKSSSVIEIAAHASLAGKKILVVDMDPSAHATRTFLGNDITETTIYDALNPDTSICIDECVYDTTEVWENVDIVPSKLALQKLMLLVDDPKETLFQLDVQMENIKYNYDFVLIDVGAQANLLAQISYAAADYVIIPTDDSDEANKEIETTRGLIEQVKRFTRSKPSLFKIIRTGVTKEHSAATKTSAEFLQNKYAELLFSDPMIHCSKVKEGRQQTPKIPAAFVLPESHKLFKAYKKLTNQCLKAK